MIKIDTKETLILDASERLFPWINNKKFTNKVETITLKYAITLDKKTRMVSENTVGFLMNDSNNVYANTEGVYILFTHIIEIFNIYLYMKLGSIITVLLIFYMQSRTYVRIFCLVLEMIMV